MAVPGRNVLRKVTIEMEWENGATQVNRFYCDEETSGNLEQDLQSSVGPDGTRNYSPDNKWNVIFELQGVKRSDPEV